MANSRKINSCLKIENRELKEIRLALKQKSVCLCK